MSGTNRAAHGGAPPPLYGRRRWFPAAAFLALVFAALQAACSPSRDHGEPRVAKVVDGDTIHLTDGTKVRYIGIDTPEMKDKRPAVRRMAAEAKEANRRLVEGKPIRLKSDVRHTDRYGRPLAYVYAGDVFVNEELVRSGYASAYTVPPNVEFSERFVALEREAREARRGLWAMGDLEAATR